MQVDFFCNPYKQTTSVARFGICDDTSDVHIARPAYINVEQSEAEEWIAEVRNGEEKKVDFYPIDNCLNLLREDGTRDNCCDCMLAYDSSLMFVELKDRYDSKYLAKGIKQLKSTLEHFKANHNTDDFQITARVCNRRPCCVVSCKQQMEQFRNSTGIRLDVDRVIRL